jgi:hypothetical protein
MIQPPAVPPSCPPPPPAPPNPPIWPQLPPEQRTQALLALARMLLAALRQEAGHEQPR